MSLFNAPALWTQSYVDDCRAMGLVVECQGGQLLQQQACCTPICDNYPDRMLLLCLPLEEEMQRGSKAQAALLGQHSPNGSSQASCKRCQLCVNQSCIPSHVAVLQQQVSGSVSHPLRVLQILHSCNTSMVAMPAEQEPRRVEIESGDLLAID